jgi:hypothetical protein
MNRPIKNPRFVKVMLSVIAASTMWGAHAQRGVLEIHGVLTSPGCQLKLHDLQRFTGQTQVNGQACGLTSGPGNALSFANIAHIAEETLTSPSGTGQDKKLMTLSYR